MHEPPSADRNDLMLRFAPALFVLLWSSGFIAAKAGLADAEPLTYLSLRYWIVAILMAGLALAMRAPWPRSRRELGHVMIAGVMLQAIYFAGSWLALGRGVGAGTAALIVCLQPVITAVLAGPLLGERVSPRQWLGLALGLTGVGLVVSHKLGAGLGSAEGVAWAFLGLLGITFGTLYQKKFCRTMDPRSGTAIQFLVAAVLLTPIGWLFEDGTINWTPSFIASLGYIVVVMSLFTMILLTMMIQRGEASRVTGWFFLVPPSAALLAWIILDEPFGPVALAGMAVAAVGVALVMTSGRATVGKLAN